MLSVVKTRQGKFSAPSILISLIFPCRFPVYRDMPGDDTCPDCRHRHTFGLLENLMPETLVSHAKARTSGLFAFQGLVKSDWETVTSEPNTSVFSTGDDPFHDIGC